MLDLSLSLLSLHVTPVDVWDSLPRSILSRSIPRVSLQCKSTWKRQSQGYSQCAKLLVATHRSEVVNCRSPMSCSSSLELTRHDQRQYLGKLLCRTQSTFAADKPHNGPSLRERLVRSVQSRQLCLSHDEQRLVFALSSSLLIAEPRSMFCDRIEELALDRLFLR